jgi:zinc transporter 5/7
MKTNNMLLVSTIGLAINLFGMWATGGHHHHGHDHGHGHSHGHAHTHIPVNEKKVSHHRPWASIDAQNDTREHHHAHEHERRDSHGVSCLTEKSLG